MAAAVMCVLLATAPRSRAASGNFGGAGVGSCPPSAADLGQPRPDLARIFTPLTADPGRYTVSTTPRVIGELVADLKTCDPAPAEGAWSLTHPEAHEAFGQAGIYDRSRLAQLFGGRRLTVARGSLRTPGGRSAFTVISPYPDPAMTRIEPGTMIIAIRVTP
jgi:hypothetical protein